MRQQNLLLWQLGLAALTTTLLMSCGRKRDSNGVTSRSVEGRLGSSYHVAHEPLAIELEGHDQYVALEDEYAADAVVAVPVQNGNVSRAELDAAVTASIESDGSFHLDLMARAGTDYVVMLVNTQATEKADKVVGFLAIPDSGSSLLRIPLASATEDLNFGTLEANGDEARSSNDLESQQASFGLSSAQLREIAEVDDVLRNVKNFYINSNETTWFESEPSFGFKAPPASVKNAWGHANDFVYEGYLFQVSTNRDSPSAEEVCSGATAFGIYAPTGLSFSTKWEINKPAMLNTDAPVTLSSQGGRQTCGNFRDFGVDDDHGGGTRYSFGTDFGITDVLQGLWTVKWGNQELAQFDIEVASPLNLDGKPLSYVPTLKVNVGDGDTITSIEVRWYRWNSLEARYEEVTDLGLLSESISDISLGIADYSGPGGARVEENHTGAVSGVSTMEKSFKYFGNASSSEAVVDDIAVSYSLGGVNFTFEWEN